MTRYEDLRAVVIGGQATVRARDFFALQRKGLRAWLRETPQAPAVPPFPTGEGEAAPDLPLTIHDELSSAMANLVLSVTTGGGHGKS